MSLKHGENVSMVIPFVTTVCLLFHMYNECLMCERLLKSSPHQPDAPALILIEQDLPAALVDIKLNRPFDGRHKCCDGGITA